MALSFSSTAAIKCSKLYDYSGLQITRLRSNKRNQNAVDIKCESTGPELPGNAKKSKLAVGSPVIVVEAPRMIKTAASVPCLRVNTGLVKPGENCIKKAYGCMGGTSFDWHISYRWEVLQALRA
ncbi:protein CHLORORESPIRATORY REDUCTION 42, chloroplastic [Argentina anserina]|uniref:protein CHLORORESPIRATORY REDUCTION 42, chloroplastic n=1 Tax=Argentina anserina TaxID=57926 RepID=UPI0021765D9B|nr:protein CHLORORESPIRATORY REDUCTION 42, chloroplastic [Potentilla anserina]